MNKLERDQTLLTVFTNHLHSTGALSVPPEDLNVAIEEVSERFAAVEIMVDNGDDEKGQDAK